jgi:hypothetical protein
MALQRIGQQMATTATVSSSAGRASSGESHELARLEHRRPRADALVYASVLPCLAASLPIWLETQ